MYFPNNKNTQRTIFYPNFQFLTDGLYQCVRTLKSIFQRISGHV
jgi:hypothetical protein